MKKFLTLFMSIMLLVGTITCADKSAYAAAMQIYGGTSKSSAVNLEFSKEYAQILSQGGTKWFKFKTKDSDNYWYNISVNNVSVGNNNGFAGVSGTIYDYYDEKLANATSFNSIGESGAKLESDTTYYLAIWGVREGTIKFQLDATYDEYGETNSEASYISINTTYDSSIDARGNLSDNRISDKKNGDIDVVKFNSGEHEKLKLTLNNSDVDYYNTYYEGICAIVSDAFGEILSYIEVRPNSSETDEFTVERNTTYYIKFFATSGGIGKYKFILECVHSHYNSAILKNPTCTESGIRTYTCSICGNQYTETLSKTAHKYKTVTVKKANTKQNGSVVTKCSVCGEVKSSTTIYYPKTITLSTTTYTYNGKVKTPSVTVKDSKGNKISANNYTVTYSSGRKNVGKYTVTIKFKGNYSGTVKKTFTIKPKNTSISKLTAGKKKLTVKWKKQTTQTTGYQIQYSTSSNFKNAKTVTVSKNKTTSKTISKLKANKKYYVRIRTYKTVSGTKYYSAWSSAKSVKVK